MPARKPQRTLRPTPAPSHARSLHRPPQQEAVDSHTARPPPVNNRISRPTPQSIQGPHAVSASSPPTDEPPPADKRAFRPTAAARIQRPYAAPRCTSRFATTGPSSATGTTRTSTSTSATGTGPAQAPRSGTKKQPSPRWGRLSSLCSNRLRGRSHGAEARS